MSASSTTSEKKRGYEEASRQFEVLRVKWPKAFPAKAHEVRPLVSGTVKTISETLGWSGPYAKAVLQSWKLRESYCRAVLAYRQRIALDGSESDELVDEAARKIAEERLVACQKRRERNAERRAKVKNQAEPATA